MNTNIQNKGSEDTPSTGFLRNLSIKKKLVLIIMLVSSIGLLLAGSSFIVYEWFSLRKRMINDLNTHSEMIADNCTGSLSFDDPQDAEEVLGSLQHIHPIEYACVYSSDGVLFAAYKREDVNVIISSGSQQDGCRFEDGRLVLFKQITLNNNPIGTLYLQSDLSLISRFLKESIIALAIMIFLLSIIAYLLASRLQKVVSAPIFYLAKIAGIVTQKGDYSVRAKKYTEDELGVLTDAFNNMLIQVEKREISLRESRERFSLAVEGASVGLWEWNVITGEDWWSDRFRELIGYKSDELPSTYESWKSLLHPDDLEKTLEAIRLHLETGKIYNIEYRLRTKNGDYRWFLARGVAAKDEKGRPTRMSGSIQDITERKKAEEALQESERKYRTLFEQSEDAALIIEGDNFVDCNSATVKMLGYKNKKELLNTHPSQLSPPLQPDGQDSFEKANKMMAMAFDKGSNRFEWDHQRKNGEVFPVEVLLTSIPHKEGNFLHVVWRDLTERKLAEKELENYRKHLEALVNERTRELEEVHAELVRKERLAALGELIATVSHEIRNPLGTVRNAVYSIGEAISKNKMDVVDRALKLSENNITRCNRIINELLDYTRKREIKLEQAEIDSWLNEVLDEQEFPKEIKCVRELHSGIVLQIDREYMRRVIFNVITNAIQALQEEDSRGNLITVESVKVGKWLELRFIDTGPGIPEEIREKIFEPLFSTKSFGVGLGVPIVKNIMEEHHGEVKFQSEVGKGTIVTLTLPISKLKEKDKGSV